MEETRLGGMIVKWQNSTDRHIDTSTPQNQQKCILKGGLLLNTFVFFQIATKVLSFANFLQLLSFVDYFCHFL
jgi:hypothetical protein